MKTKTSHPAARHLFIQHLLVFYQYKGTCGKMKSAYQS
ncbi:hypothetical protein BAXH7_03788 [Bacillus amyloliquefaciens XH7]|nr:hypothetical protein BAXH7_03788 [Bacillus amyloliquefaciens XH7]KYC98947.1 hypothetical protein B425_3415 [Bacillus amyloliquefaciens]QBG58129.1 hypothetical protein D2M30_3830 [Bacillus amyloliquefaciens]